MSSVEIEVERYSATECFAYDEDGTQYGDFESALLTGQMTPNDVARAILEAVTAREVLDPTLADEDRTTDVAVLVTITMTGEATVNA